MCMELRLHPYSTGRNERRCPPQIAEKFNNKQTRNDLFNDWMYNGKDLDMLSVLYTRISYYRKALSIQKVAFPII